MALSASETQAKNVIDRTKKQRPLGRCPIASRLYRLSQAADIFFRRAARRETLREPVFLWTTPLLTARISSD